MGVLRRAWDYIKGVKQRADDWFHKETHKEELEVLQAKNFKNEKHREIRAELDPIIYALVQRVANLITARSPIFLDDADNELEDLKEQWEKNYYNDLLNDVIQSTRTHGYMVLEPNIEDFDEDRNWLVHDPTDIMMMVFKKLKIEKYTVLPLIEGGDKVAITETVTNYDLFPNDVIHFYIGKFKLNRCGVATIKPIWDNCVRYSEIIGAMSRYDSRIGNGMMVVSVDPKAYKGDTAKLSKAIKNTNTKNFLILKEGLGGQPVDIKWEGSNRMLKWSEDLGEIMKLISGASGFPVRWFIGDPKGSQSAAKEDRIAIWTTLKEIFGEYIPFIRKLFLKMEGGEAINEKVKEIVFDDGGNLADKDEQFDESSDEDEETELEGENDERKER